MLKIYNHNKEILTGYENNGLYFIEFDETGISGQLLTVKKKDSELWHEKLGHTSDTNLELLKKLGYINFTTVNEKCELCEICISSKMCKVEHKTQSSHSKSALQLVHTDLCQVKSKFDSDLITCKYMLTFIDDFTHFTIVYLLNTKSEVESYLRKYIAMVQNKFDKNIKRLRCDNGKEYVNHEINKLCDEYGITLEFTLPYSPESNGKAERMNRTILEKTRCLINQSGINERYYTDALYTAVYLINRLPTRGLQRLDIPATLWYGRRQQFDRSVWNE